MYEAGKILYAGGGRTTNTAEVIDLNQGSPAWQWTGSMAFPRRNLNATMLPTGEVLVTGGSSAVGFNNVTQAVRAAEIWNPGTGLWTTLASNAVRRTYHSTSLLLPDGRVLHTGSGDADGMPDERNAELFSPPYLAKGARPAITTAPAQVGYGSTFSVETPEAADIGKVSLIRLGSVTHSFDQNQRFQWLSFVRGPGRLTVTAPANGNLAPPGHYLLFILNGNGVPSVGRIVKVASTSQPSQPNSAPAAAFLGGCGGLTCTFADRSADADGNLAEWTWDFGDGESSTARDPNHLYAAGGTYSVTLTARDREGASGTATRQISVPGQPYPISLSLTTSSSSSTQTATLTWSRAQGSDLYVYRNGLVLLSTPNDGRQAITRSGSGPTTYIFKVCEAGTTICSNPATAQFNGGAPTDNAVPNAIFTPGCSGLTCRFTDGSIDTDGTVAAWRWTFGDGASSTQRHPSHTYASGGTYTVTLTGTDDRGGQGSTSRPVSPAGAGNAPPSAGFTASCTDLACDFTDASSDGDGSLTAWEWDFGDGATASARNPSHGYAAAGT
jgi:PKD repeat protein